MLSNVGWVVELTVGQPGSGTLILWLHINGIVAAYVDNSSSYSLLREQSRFLGCISRESLLERTFLLERCNIQRQYSMHTAS
jgi:hypothetical protein